MILFQALLLGWRNLSPSDAPQDAQGSGALLLPVWNFTCSSFGQEANSTSLIAQGRSIISA